MLHKISREDFKIVVNVLDAYLYEKQTNNLLWSWKNLKKRTNRPKHQFSSASFAKPKSKTEKNIKRQEVQIQEQVHSNKSNTQSQNEPAEEKKYFLRKRNPTFQAEEQLQQDEAFQDMVLQKIKAIQSRLTTIKSQSSSSVYQSQSSTKRSKSEYIHDQGTNTIKFQLNPRYIPMQQKMNEMQSIIYETQNYEISSREGNSQGRDRRREDGAYGKNVETPKIGGGGKGKNQGRNMMPEQLNQSTLSAEPRRKTYQEMIEKMGSNSFLREISGELTSQKSSKAFTHFPLTTMSKPKPEQIPKSTQKIAYHPDVGYFKMIPISNNAFAALKKKSQVHYLKGTLQQF